MEETISTLRFASTAKRIKNKARINEDAKDALLRRFQEQIRELKRQLDAEDGENSEVNGNSENDNRNGWFAFSSIRTIFILSFHPIYR